MKKLVLCFFVSTVMLFCVTGQTRSPNLTVNRGIKRSLFINETKVQLENEKVFLLKRNQQIRIVFSKTSEIVSMRVSPSPDWEDNRAIDYTTFSATTDNDNNIYTLQGRTIPDNYYLLIIFGDISKSPLYIIKMKTDSDFSQIKKNLLSPLSLGGAFTLSIDGNYTKDATPMFYYHYDYTLNGDSFWSYLLTGSIGIVCNPSLASINSDNGWKNLLTSGIGIGIFENTIITGLSCSFKTGTINWFIGLNL